MGILYVAVLLIIGFLWTDHNKAAGYRQHRSDGWNAYFNAGKYGLCFTIPAFIIFSIIDFTDCARPILKYLGVSYSDIQQSPVDLKFVSIATLAALLLYITIGIRNLFKLNQIKNSKVKVICSDSPLTLLIYDCVELSKLSESPVFLKVALKSGKVYIGLPISEPAFSRGQLSEITLAPWYSGYRSHQTQQLKLTTDYSYIYMENDFSFELFQVTVRVEEIECVSLFSFEECDKLWGIDRLFQPEEQSMPVKPSVTKSV